MKEKQGFEVVKNCFQPRLSTLLAPYLNGDLTSEETRMLEDHLPECAECQEKLGLIMMIAAHGLRGWKRRDERGAKASRRSKGEVVPFRR